MSINPSDDGIAEIKSLHTIYAEIIQSEIGQLVGSPFLYKVEICGILSNIIGSFSNGISIAEFNPSTLLLYYNPLYIILIISCIDVIFV